MNDKGLEFDYFFDFIASDVLFQDYLDITVIGCRRDTIMQCGEAKAHVADIKVSIPGIFTIYHLYRTSFFFIPSFINYKEIPA